MKKQNIDVFIAFWLILSLLSINIHSQERKILFDEEWKFHRGSVANAEQPSHNDSKWRVLNIPHDWSVESVPIQKEGITIGPFTKMSDGGAGGADTGQTLGGEGWYRKEFKLELDDVDKLVTLYFEGVYNQSEVWVNGNKVSFNAYGYTSYKVDITEYCNAPGLSNIIAVKVVNSGENSRWYAGSGIFRHVWLIKTDKIHLDEWDTFIDASELQGKDAIAKLSTIVHNKTSEKIEGYLFVKIFSPSGIEVYSSKTKIGANPNSKTPISLSVNVTKPNLWSVDNPSLYKAEIKFVSEDRGVDHITIPFGIRTIAFTAKKGFVLNGTSIKLKGGCIHHDNGLLGAAAIDRAEERKVELLKANGYNAVRCAHNQVSEHFLNTCDRLGILVIHETFDQWQEAKRSEDYHQYFDEWSEKDLIASLRRDRNHPSIIMWSIGNEIAQRADSIGEEIAQQLTKIIHRYDKSRYTTIGANDFWDRRHVGFTWDNDIERTFRNVDVAGYNYMWWKYESDVVKYPQRIIYGSESYPKDAALNWNLVEKYSNIIGDFVWTAIDYIGEAGLGHSLELSEGEHDSQFMGWPWYNAWCGDIDLCGDKKPQSYYRDVVWCERDITMAVHPPVALGKKEIVNAWGWPNEYQSWNWKGMEGQLMQVNVYSRSPIVRLYQDGKLIGEKETGKENYTATFEVPYRVGHLKAVNVEKKKETNSFELCSAGNAASIRLIVDRSIIDADGRDLAYVKIELIDDRGNLVTDSDSKIKISCSGTGHVIAAGNAAYADMESFRSLTPRLFRGRAMAIVQSSKDKGVIELIVKANEVPEARISLKTE